MFSVGISMFCVHKSFCQLILLVKKLNFLLKPLLEYSVHSVFSLSGCFFCRFESPCELKDNFDWSLAKSGTFWFNDGNAIAFFSSKNDLFYGDNVVEKFDFDLYLSISFSFATIGLCKVDFDL